MWSAVHALFNPTVETLRIDRPIKKFYETRDMRDGLVVIQGIAFLVIEGFIFSKIGFKKMAPSAVAMNFAFDYFFQPYSVDSIPFDRKAAFPFSNAIQHISLGLVVGVLARYLLPPLILKIIKMMQGMGFALQDKQSIAIAMQSSGILARFTNLIGCTFIPYMEEVVFRGILMNKMLESHKPEKMIAFGPVRINLSKLETLIKTSFIFGLLHATFAQSWTNIPIIAGANLMGGMLGSLRLMTGNLWAPTVAHMLNNTLVTANLVYGIKMPSLTTSLTEMLKDKRIVALLILA